MRILAVCMEDPHEILGGMGMHVRELYREMATRFGVEIDLLVDSTNSGSETIDGYRKHYSDKLVCWKPRRPDFACLQMIDIQMARTLTRMLASGGRWDVIHCHEWNALQVSRMARDALGVPMVGTMHLCLSKLCEVENPGFNYATLGEADLYMMQQEGSLISDPQELILCSQSYVDMARGQFMTGRPVNMIPNGIDLREWHPGAGDGERARRRHSLRGRPIALYVGRIATMKGITHLLDAVAEADTEQTVVLAGEVNANDEKSKKNWDVTRRIEELQEQCPERLRWVGFQHGQALKDLYAAADCVVMPSVHEPFGIVALEAMAMGTPLLSTEVDGLGEIVNDAAGNEFALIIKHRDPKAIIDGLQIMRQASARSELAALGLQRAADFSWSAAVDRTLEVYENACRTKRPRETARSTARQNRGDQDRGERSAVG